MTLRVAALGLLLTCPVGHEESCNHNRKAAWIEVHHSNPISGEILYTEVVCGDKIVVEGRCAIVWRNVEVVAAACPGMAAVTDLPANWVPLPAEEERP